MNTMTTDGNELGYTEFVDVQPELGDWDDYEAAVEHLNECYSRASEGTPYTIVSRPARSGEASGLYAETAAGRLQIVGGTIPVPDDVAEIQRWAWDLFCE